MIYWIVLGYAAIPTLFNITVVLNKRKKTLNKICKALEEKGYKTDQRLKNNIPQVIIENVFKKKYDYSDYSWDLKFYSYCMFVRWYGVFYNIKYLMGDYTGMNESYAMLEDSISNYKTIYYLEYNGLIKEDEEKKNWISDRDNALKELEKKNWFSDRDNALKKLEKKSEDIKVDSEIHIFSKNDKLDELDELYITKAELELTKKNKKTINKINKKVIKTKKLELKK